MKTTRVIGILIVLVLSLSKSVQGQTCTQQQLLTPGNICQNEVSYFSPLCNDYTANWYVDGNFVGTSGILEYTFTTAGSHTVRMDYYPTGSGSGGTQAAPMHMRTRSTPTSGVTSTPLAPKIKSKSKSKSGVLVESEPSMEGLMVVGPGEGGGGSSGSITKNVYVHEKPDAPFIQASPDALCSAGNVSLSASVSNVEGQVTYTWSSIPSGYSGTGPSLTANNITQTTTFNVSVFTGSCWSENSATVVMEQTLIQPVVDAQMPYHKRLLRGSEQDYKHYWWFNGASTGKSLVSDYAATQEGNYYIRKDAGSCWTSAGTPVNVTLNFAPDKAVVLQIPRGGSNEIVFMHTDKTHILTFADYYWVADAGSNPQIVAPYIVNNGLKQTRLTSSGTYYLKGKDRGTGTWGQTLTLNVTVRGDEGLNWIHTKAFDGRGEGTPVSESKNYFDDAGKPLQSQTKNIEAGRVFATQSLTDKYDRAVGSTLAAPITPTDFKYTAHLLLDGDKNLYSFNDFDEPANRYNANAVDDETPGTVGWYYSEQNTLEPLVGKTNYPYTRTEFYEDGTGEVKRAASAGDQHRLGAGHEVLKGTFPVHDELDDYVTQRDAVLGISSDGDLRNEGVQTVARDENGKYAISITDKSGKSVMTARPGTSADKVLTVVNTATSSSMIYFYILSDFEVTLSGSNDFVVENIVTDEAKNPGVTFAGQNGKWPAGFYRVLVNSGTVTVGYTNYYLDVSYQFYDDMGRLKESVSPNGFKAWKAGTSAYADIDKTKYEYNFRGWLLSTTEVDAGTSTFKYRKDGKIRFSQNAQQAYHAEQAALGQQLDKGKFSYTHYDGLGRPIESGEYKGTAVTFSSLSDKLELIGSAAQAELPAADTKDWVKTSYDFADGGFYDATGFSQSQFVQEFTRGAVSFTENANVKTWYSYDELGRVTWMAQQPVALKLSATGKKRVFVTTYEYDFLGNVLTQKNSMYEDGSELTPFQHHYEYDKDKRLSKVYTSIDGVNKKLRASYVYYLHGPLKRIELGEKVQGVDFVYNINGWLTQINHPDKANDPGHDGTTSGFKEDAFGMVLDYYESDLQNLFQTSMQVFPVNPDLFHGLPDQMMSSYQLAYDARPVFKVSDGEWKEMIRKAMHDRKETPKEQTSIR